MKGMLARVAAAVAVVVVAIVAARPSAPPASADPTYIFLVNQGICTALTISSGNTCGPINAPIALDYNNATGDSQISLVSNALGNNNNVIEPSDFTGVATFSGGQLMQQSGDQPSMNAMSVVAFVQGVSPVTFQTSAGYWYEGCVASGCVPGTTSQTWTCTGTTTTNPDSDCGGPNSLASGVLGADHVVVATLLCTIATCPTFGTQNISVIQNGIIYPVTFTVVGEPRTVSFFTLETGIQAGVPVPSPMTHAAVATSCPFSASLPFIQKALGEAEKTVIVARAADINGTNIAGAWINWTVDNNGAPTNVVTFAADGSIPTNFDSQGILAQPTTPTLNLGGFGYGAPNILCAPATAQPGKVTVRATLSRFVSGTALADPEADPGGAANNLAFGETSFDVTGFPASMTVTAAPASLTCDGNATSTVSAALVDASGNPMISGTAVHFDVQVLGTANPIDTTTNDKGIATSTITPLSGSGRGVPVTVSVTVGGAAQPQLTQQILVACAAAAPGGQPAGGGGAPAGGAGGGGTTPPTGITGPNTGTGPLGSGAGRLSWWPAVALLAGALGLAAVRLRVVRERDR